MYFIVCIQLHKILYIIPRKKMMYLFIISNKLVKNLLKNLIKEFGQELQNGQKYQEKYSLFLYTNDAAKYLKINVQSSPLNFSLSAACQVSYLLP